MFDNENYVVLEIYEGNSVEDTIPFDDVEKAIKFMNDGATDSYENGDQKTYVLYKRMPMVATVAYVLSDEHID